MIQALDFLEVTMSVEKQIILLLQKAYHTMEQAACQSHSGHWDKEGTHGANCPECIRATELTKTARTDYEQAVCLLTKVQI